MTKNHTLIGIGLCAALVACVSAAQGPVVNIGDRHGNLRQAQVHIVEAYRLIGEAQRDNDSRLGGHAARAKELLNDADGELRQAADVANEH